MRTKPAKEIQPGDLLVGDAGHLSLVTGEVDESNVIFGAMAIETEHGTLYVDGDEEMAVQESDDTPDPG